jgi:hypothetical protein
MKFISKLALLIWVLTSCSTTKYVESNNSDMPSSKLPKMVRRLPSSSSSGSCVDLLAESLRQGHHLERSSWDTINLASQGFIDINDLESLKNSKQWLSYLEEAGPKNEEQQEMALTVLAILKKKYPNASEVNLKERFGVLMRFCS